MRQRTGYPWQWAIAGVVALTLACGGWAWGSALAAERFVQKLSLAPGLVAVVAEGDLEARSIGSYSVRIYFDPASGPENEITFYTAGLVRGRDGVLLSIAPLVLGEGQPTLLMVVMQSAGSGGYLSADAFAVTPRDIELKASVRELPATENPATSLRRQLAGARP
ncbi:MAG: PliI family lysozyme inhibitor of I-type lysozyme [Limnohabitans sp.]